jgi:predicted HicB family RNase H-like nuclease
MPVTILLKSSKEGHSNDVETYSTDLDEDGSGRSRIMNADANHRRSFPLRLAKSLAEMASTLACRDGVSLNHFICLAVAEKISRLEHDGLHSKREGGPTSMSMEGSGLQSSDVNNHGKGPQSL